MSVEKPEIQFGRLGDTLYVDVQGRPTQRVAPTVARVVDDYLSAHSETAVCTIDLAGADWIDSTFAGCLIGIYKRLAQRGGQLRLNHCANDCRKSLAKMHLHNFAEFTEVPAPRSLQTLRCATGDRPTPDEIRLMLAAHEELAAIDEHNERIFGPVVNMLRQQLVQLAGEG